MTSCSHTFCSLCIRRCLSADGRCPVCRSEDQELRLRRNWVAEEMVEGWRPGREGVLKELQNLAQSTVSQPFSNGDRKAKRRKISHDGEKIEETSSGRSTRSRTKKAIESSQDLSEHKIAQPVEVIDDSEDDGSEYEQEGSPAVQGSFAPGDGLVPCPMCNKRMKEEAVFSHLDRCTGSSAAVSPVPSHPDRFKQRSSVTIAAAGRRDSAPALQERLPTINYSLFKDQALRNKLKDLGIPNWGSKQLLQRRHTEWLNLWNANCDSRHPRSKRELLGDLETWERTQGGHAPSNGGSNMMFISGPGHTAQASANDVGEKDFDKTGWSKSHEDDFKDLIRQARAKRVAGATTAAATSSSPTAEQQGQKRSPTVLADDSAHGLPSTAQNWPAIEPGTQSVAFHPVLSLEPPAALATVYSSQSKSKEALQPHDSQDPQFSLPASSSQDKNAKSGRVFG